MTAYQFFRPLPLIQFWQKTMFLHYIGLF